MAEYVEPSFGRKSFTCPHCKTLTTHRPHHVHASQLSGNFSSSFLLVTICDNCHDPVVWVKEQLVYPIKEGIEPEPNMPPKALEFFKEAQLVSGFSPRAACALLRLSLEEIVNELGGKGNNLNERILSLNLSPKLKPLFDACRLVGNHSAHPGVINFDDDENADLAMTLSKLINIIVMFQITPFVEAQKAIETVEKGKTKLKAS